MMRSLIPTAIVLLVTVLVVGIFSTQSRIDEINLSRYELLLMRASLDKIDQSLNDASLNDQICIMVSRARDANNAIADKSEESAKRIEQMIADRERVWFRVLDEVEEVMSDSLIMARHGER